MKVHKQKPKRDHADGVPLQSLFASPPANFYRLPDFELRGGYLTTEGCRRVLDFEPEKICLDMGNFLVTFYGKELRIESLTGKRLILAGKFATIVFRNKWEAPDHDA